MICKICNIEFKNLRSLSYHLKHIHKLSSESYYITFFGIEGKCLECGQKTKFININEGYKKYCSKKCSANSKELREKYKQTCIEKYGVENAFQSDEIKEKIRQSNLEKYGVDNPSQSDLIKEKKKQTCLKTLGVEYSSQSKEIQEKIKRTNLERYGCKNPQQNKEVREKTKQTCLKKYGFCYPLQSEEIKVKIKKSNLKKHGVENPFQSEKIKDKIKKTNLEKYKTTYILNNKYIYEKANNTRIINYYNNLFNSSRLENKCTPNFDYYEYTKIEEKYSWKCNTCETIFEDHLDNGHVPRCPQCFPNNRSLFEQEVADFCKQFFPGLIENNRSILNGRELDIYIPKINIAIECNGLFWHSEINGKDKNYHLNKTIECQEKNIHLIHIFDDEWYNEQEKIKNIILEEMEIKNRIIKNKEKIEIDRRFSNGEYLLENGFSLEKIIEPSCYCMYNLNKISEKNCTIVWDCGKLIFRTNS